jgi:hypothetical protein
MYFMIKRKGCTMLNNEINEINEMEVVFELVLPLDKC